jgi:hypothetical protein
VTKQKWAIEVKGLKCDNPDCDYHTDEIDLDHYEKYIGELCPKCGKSLLTQIDYDHVMMINRLMSNPIIKFINWMGRKLSPESVKTYKINMNGTGEIKIEPFDRDLTK